MCASVHNKHRTVLMISLLTSRQTS